MLHVGMDMHKRFTVVTVVDEEGERRSSAVKDSTMTMRRCGLSSKDSTRR